MTRKAFDRRGRGGIPLSTRRKASFSVVSVVQGLLQKLWNAIDENETSRCGHRCRSLRRVDRSESLGKRGTGYFARCLGAGEFAGIFGWRDSGDARDVWARSTLHADGGPRA